MIFPDCTWVQEGGCMYSGSSVKVGPIPAKSQVGFWIKSDGYTNSNGYVYYSVHNTSTPVKSPDGLRHTAWVGVENNITLIGFEDLYNLGDKDYNDGKREKTKRFVITIQNYTLICVAISSFDISQKIFRPQLLTRAFLE